jgi:hypothetical protein
MGDSPTPVNGSAGENDGGVASNHAVPQTLPVLVAPTTAAEFNTVRAALIPVGCWRLEDLRFEFDSSIIRPEARKEFGKFSELCKSHAGAPVSLFGHADPVGDDAYNKSLSGRRVEAVYAVLTRNLDMWEKLYGSLVEGTGDAWKYRAIQVALKALGFDPGAIDGKLNATTTTAVKKFQSDNGLKDDGDPGPITRGQLFPKYMDFLAGGFKLTPADFLGKGAGPDGKADYQGCSEFNPVLMFSASENKAFQDPSKKEQRNSENAPNRRVLALLFRPGTKIDPSKWPCPTTRQGIEGCQKRLWSDAGKRRQFQEKRRTFDSNKDTFACRFYHRLMVSSPCEGIKPVPIPVPLETVKPLIVPGANQPQPEASAAPGGGASALADSPKDKGSDDAAAKPSVGPSDLVAIVKRPYTNPNPAIVILKTDVAFDGTGTLTRSKAIVDFFRKGSKTPIQFGKDNTFSGADLTKGIELEAVGLKPSDTVKDIELTLTLSGGSKKIDPPAKAKMTSVEVLLDICEPRTSASTDPPVLATATAAPASGATSTDKFFGGRPLPLQFDATYYDERAIVIVKQVKPKDFKAQLVLNADDDKVKIFAAEKPTKGEAAITLPKVIDSKTVPDDGLKFFVEGAKESVAARDTGVRLGIQAMTDVGDRVAITVCHTEVVSNKEAKDLKVVAQVPEKPARTTKSKFVPAPLIVGKDYDVEMRPHIELAKMSAFQWTTPSASITLTDAAKEVVKVKATALSAKLDDIEMDVLLTTDLGKLKKKHKLTCVHVEINPVLSGDNIRHGDDINMIRNPAGCVLLSGGDAADTSKVPKYEITKIEPNLTWTDDDDRIAWWVVGGESAGDGKYDGKADFHSDEKSKRGTKIQIFGTQAGDVLIQPYSGGYGYGMYRANVVPIRKVKYRINRIFTTAQAAIPAQPALTALPAVAAQPPFPGTTGIPAQPAVPDLPAIAARPAVAAIAARAAHTPTASHAEALLHMKIVNIYLRQAGIEMIPDDSAEMASPARTARPALPAVAAQAAVAAQVATPALPATATTPAVAAQPAVGARPAIPDLPAMPEIKASTVNNNVGQASLDQKIIEIKRVQAGHFDVEVDDVSLTFNASSPNSRSAIRINARNEVVTFAYIESQPGTKTLATALLCPQNHAPQARKDPPRAYSTASYTLPDKGIPSSSLIPKTGIPPDVPVGEVKMIVLFPDVSWQGASPATRDVNLLWGVIVPTTSIDNSAGGGATQDQIRLAYGNTLAHEIGHVLGLGHRGVAGDPVPDGLTVPANENLMHPSNPPPTAQNVDLIQVKGIRFSEIMFRNP